MRRTYANIRIVRIPLCNGETLRDVPRASTNSNFGEVQSLGLHLSATAVTDICTAAVRSRRSRCDNISCQHKHGFENFAPPRTYNIVTEYSHRFYLRDGSHFQAGSPECTSLQKFISLRDILASGLTRAWHQGGSC